MQNSLHYPQLKRQPIELYYNSKGKFYASSNYQSNYVMIAKDCKHSCVYCDATEKECGGERFSLDHFRPQNIFATLFDGILINHPFNLHLSCQKCNVLKSKDWQGCMVNIDGPSYIDNKGYVDRFEEDVLGFVEVDVDGRIRASKDPGRYMIKRLHLNRPNRVYLRKKRHVDQLVHYIENLLSECTEEVLVDSKSGAISPVEGITRITKVEKIRKSFRRIKLIHK